MESYIVERLDVAKELAQKVLTGKVSEDEEGLELVLRFYISRHYNMPFYSEYFDNRTIDEMAFEAELIKGIVTTAVEQGTEIINAATEEQKADLFDDWAPLGDEDLAKTFNEDAKKFMQNGDFKQGDKK